MSKKELFLIRFSLLLPAIMTLFGVIFLLPYSDSFDLSLLVIFYLLTGFGVTIGFHRLFTHRSFETSPTIQIILVILGSMAGQGPLYFWVATHRKHHAFSDKVADPHTPSKGFWHAHIGWMWTPEPINYARYSSDLMKLKYMQKYVATYFVWVLLGLLIPALLSYWHKQSAIGLLTGLVWGGFARIFLVQNATWAVNSVCHMWGGKSSNTKDNSRNNWLVSIFSLGEGWHNNHHNHPTSARHGLKFWQIDASYILIYCLSKINLIRNIKSKELVSVALMERNEIKDPVSP